MLLTVNANFGNVGEWESTVRLVVLALSKINFSKSVLLISTSQYIVQLYIGMCVCYNRNDTVLNYVIIITSLNADGCIIPLFLTS